MKWRCKICGYIHEGDTPPNMCPVCGAGPEDFKLLEHTQEQQSKLAITRIIIIGNGAAGMEAARTIREHNKSVEILIFTEESYHFYSRIHLSKFIGKQSKENDIQIYPASWYDEQRITVFLDTPVILISPQDNEIRDSRESTYKYNKLIIATGASAFIPPIEGSSLKGIFSLRNLTDAIKIREKAQNCHSAIIVGGGILGIEAASSLKSIGLSVSIIETAHHLMLQQLDQDASMLLQSILEDKGINFYLNHRVVKFLGVDHLKSAVLDTGKEIKADLALISTGISPNVSLARDADINVNRGIIVNDHLQTNFPNIYAAGDVSEFQGTIMGIWPSAVDQGIVAAKNALGIKTKYTGTVPLHILKVSGLELTTIGQKYKKKSTDKEIKYINKQKRQYLKLIYNRNIILGIIILGIAGIGFGLEKLIKNKTPIKEIMPHLEKGNWDIVKKKLRRL